MGHQQQQNPFGGGGAGAGAGGDMNNFINMFANSMGSGGNQMQQ